MTKQIYTDHAATTFLSPTALDAMMPYLKDGFGNPSSLHSFGEVAAEAVFKARSTIADILNCLPEEIIFTSGGSEADNQAVLTFEAYAKANNRQVLLVSGVEHHAVLYPANALADEGISVIALDPDDSGAVSPSAVADAIKNSADDICGGSFMLVNNETGSIFDIRKISEAVHAAGGLVHTDAVQAVGHIPVDFAALGVDMLSLSAHKFHGPKGIGALICRKEITPAQLIRGGSQERGIRAGTENTAGIVGMAAALSESAENMAKDAAHIRRLRDMLANGLRPLGAKINGGGAPGILSVRFDGADGEALVRSLDLFGIAASAGAACNSKTVGVSHVLSAMVLTDSEAASTVRFSLDHSNTEEEIRRIISVMSELVE